MACKIERKAKGPKLPKSARILSETYTPPNSLAIILVVVGRQSGLFQPRFIDSEGPPISRDLASTEEHRYICLNVQEPDNPQ